MASLEREDWDFSGVPNDELVGCCYWEYARESAFIRDTLQRYREWWAQGGKLDKTSDELFARTDRIQSGGSGTAMLLRGCAFPAGIVWQSSDPDAENHRHPDADPITGSFPAPWQNLSRPECACRSKMADCDMQPVPVPFERAHWSEARDIGKHCKAEADEIFATYRQAQRENPGKSEVQLLEEGKLPPCSQTTPSLFWESGRETTVVRINWADYTNEQLIQYFRRWIKASRPKRLPAPSRRGRKPGNVRAVLTRLAVMRLLSRFKLSHILNPRRDARSIIWESKQFAGRKWHDAAKWYDARREAEQVFRRLFPFLPPTDKPLSRQSRLPRK